MRRQHALGAAGHDEGDALSTALRRQLQQVAQIVGEGDGGVLAGEVVDATIAFGLAHHGDDLLRLDGAGGDQGLQAGEVARAGLPDFVDVDAVHGQAL